MSPLDLDGAREVCRNATPAPWRVTRETEEGHLVHTSYSESKGAAVAAAPHLLDALFIEAAREGWPAALDEIDRLRAQVEQLQLGHS